MTSLRTANAYKKQIQSYKGQFGPLPSLATQYLHLKHQVETATTENKKAAKLDELIYGEYQATLKSKHLTQSKTQLERMEVQLKMQNHIYRSDDHKDEVLYLLFPDLFAERPKSVSPPTVQEAKPVVVAAPPPLRVLNDAWDMY